LLDTGAAALETRVGRHLPKVLPMLRAEITDTRQDKNFCAQDAVQNSSMASPLTRSGKEVSVNDHLDSAEVITTMLLIAGPV